MFISNLFGQGRFTVSFEFFPPRTPAARESLMRAVEGLNSVSPDFVSVTYGAGGSTRDLTFDLCQEIQAHTPGLVMAHLTGLCHSKQEIGEIADRLWDAGITNIMALRGDRPKQVEVDSPLGSDFRYSQDLIAFLKERHPFCIGGACYPEGHTETREISQGIDHLKLKLDAGCDFLVTQLFFDNAAYLQFVKEARRAGITAPILPGIMPITSFSQVARFESQFGANLPSSLKSQILAHETDEAAVEAVGIEWATIQCRELLEQGAPGIHFYTLNRSTATLQVCQALKLGKIGVA